MFDVILVSHGPLAGAMLETAGLLCGEQERVKTFGLYPGDSIDEFFETICASIDESLGRGEVLVITDIQLGSPFNVCCRAMAGRRFRHITGMSLPVVTQVLMDRRVMSATEVAASAVEKGRGCVVDVNELLADVLDD